MPPSLKQCSPPPTQPTILKNGKAINVPFPKRVHNCNTPEAQASSSSSLFHASWLWMHRAANYMIPSGQKVQSAGASYDHRLRIHDARIVVVTRSDDDNDGEHDPDGLVGSVHPINMKLHTKKLHKQRRRRDAVVVDASNDDGHNEHEESIRDEKQNATNDQRNWELEITWCIHQQQKKHSHSAPTTTTHIEMPAELRVHADKSTYNLCWLQEWCYDKESIQRNIQKRQVTNKHTFLYKFRNNQQVDLSTYSDSSSIEMTRYERKPEYLGLRHVKYKSLIERQEIEGIYDKNDGSGSGVFDVLDSVFLDGAVIVTDIPDMNAQTIDDTITTRAQSSGNCDTRQEDMYNGYDELPVSVVGKVRFFILDLLLMKCFCTFACLVQ